EVIAEMNRLGMMVDLSHPSKGANLEAIKLSKAPVIASHSSVRALANVSRNMDDEVLQALKKNGGVIQMVGFASYVKIDSAERTAALTKLREEFAIGAGARGGGARGGAAAAAGNAPRGGRGDAAANAPAPCPVENPNNPRAPRGGGARGNAALDGLTPEKRT